ncbi:S8 family peptidase [Aquimarina sp. 2201CG14-23]|uniref:S8 family peptidase n=1 Tax=Aquimarina mycalae TaxID=3040073 RepID=UPI002477D3F9|nr:S8 family peptidase [Aquimarina sp. 2201CG14-23]MDH7445635.1 S8 family peptidase [Aquimarina sp. 2201CG14-23]
MKSTTTMMWCVMLLFTTVMWSQKTKTINQQQFLEDKDGWKMIDQQTGQKFTLSDEITIQFNKPPSKEEIRKLEYQYGMKLMRSNRLGFYDFKITTKSKILSSYERMTKEVDAEQIFTNTMGTYILTPNDPQFGIQWGLEQVSDADIDAEDAWDISTGNSNVIVAILDSGTDWTHEDIGLGTDGYQNVYLNPGEDAWANPNDPTTGNGIDDDGNGFIDDWKGWDFHNGDNDSRGPFWHGTHVAGIVGAKTNNNTGISGIAGGNNAVGCRMMLEGVGDNAPNGAIIDDAIIYAMDNGADVIQFSLSVGSSVAINTALQNAYNNGVFIVSAAGNSGAGSISYPASNVNVFSVGATTAADAKAGFSQFGSNLDLAAPGVGIRSTQIGNTYANSDGTSFAAPAVSATAALMLSVNPSLSNQEIEDILKCTADKVGGYNYNWDATQPGHSQELGYGRLNANQALIAVNTADIYIRDTLADDGTEPSSGTMYTSPDIWVRNNDDGVLTHQNPEYKLLSPNWIYVRINRKDCSNLDDGTLKLYFSKASTGLSWPIHWNNYYQMVGPNNILHGDFIGDVPIPTSPDNEVIVKIPWYPPNPADFTNDIHHFCLLARIESATDPIGIEGTSVWNNTKNNNNIAWKNISVYDVNAFNNSPPYVFIRNVDKRSRTINLSLVVTENKTGIPFEKLGAFYIIPDEKLNEIMAEAKMEGIKRVDRNVYRVYEPKAQIYQLRAEPYETFSLQLLVKPEVEMKRGTYLNYNIIQTDEEFQPTGGEEFMIGNFDGKGTDQREVLPKTIKTIDFSVYPNPSQGAVSVKLNDIYTNVGIVIRNMMGEVIYADHQDKTDQFSFELDGYKGIYFVKIITADGSTKTMKLIKN